MKDTAEGTDLCTCGHIRAIHHSGHQRTGCNSCYCPSFTKDALTVYDERAAANAEGNQPNGTFRVAKNQTCAICGESKPHVCRRTP